jgi:hypothetical protein
MADAQAYGRHVPLIFAEKHKAGFYTAGGSGDLTLPQTDIE